VPWRRFTPVITIQTNPFSRFVQYYPSLLAEQVPFISQSISVCPNPSSYPNSLPVHILHAIKCHHMHSSIHLHSPSSIKVHPCWRKCSIKSQMMGLILQWRPNVTTLLTAVLSTLKCLYKIRQPPSYHPATISISVLCPISSLQRTAAVYQVASIWPFKVFTAAGTIVMLCGLTQQSCSNVTYICTGSNTIYELLILQDSSITHTLCCISAITIEPLPRGPSTRSNKTSAEAAFKRWAPLFPMRQDPLILVSSMGLAHPRNSVFWQLK